MQPWERVYKVKFMSLCMRRGGGGGSRQLGNMLIDVRPRLFWIRSF